MASITRKELEALKAEGAELEIEPQRMVMEGLVDALAPLIPAPVDNSEILNALYKLIDKLDTSTTVKCEPVVESEHHSHNKNEINVDTAPILAAVEKLTQRPNYTFTINRDARGRIESMDARIIE